MRKGYSYKGLSRFRLCGDDTSIVAPRNNRGRVRTFYTTSSRVGFREYKDGRFSEDCLNCSLISFDICDRQDCDYFNKR